MGCLRMRFVPWPPLPVSLGSVCVLMFTTAGPTCLAIFSNSLGGTGELMTFRGVASALELCFSWPRTP